MAAPTLRLTFTNMQLRVAEFLGIALNSGSSAVAVPTDAHDLDLVKRLVNDGYRRFVNSHPYWNFLMPLLSIQFELPVHEGSVTTASGGGEFYDSTLTEADDTYVDYTLRFDDGDVAEEYQTITNHFSSNGRIITGSFTEAPAVGDTFHIAHPSHVEGETHRYWLPQGFYGELLGSFTYEPKGPTHRIDIVDERTIRELRASSRTTGDPSVCAIRSLRNSLADSTNNVRWEVMFYPTPTTRYKVYSRGRIYPDQLSATTDVTVCGYQHDEAVMACAYAEAELHRDGIRGSQNQAAEEAIRRAIFIDQSASPRRLGDYGDKTEMRASSRRPWFNGVDMYNGVEV
jgi:hypothetical protein